MERLTKRTEDGIWAKEDYGGKALSTLYSCYGGKPNLHYTNCEEGYCAIEKLAAYEDAEEQGLLLRLPCKVGDIVYVIGPKYIACKEQCALYDGEECLKTWCKEYCPNGFKGIGVLETVINRMDIMENDIRVMTSNVGYRNLNNIFLTKQEAEAKLAEMENSNDN